MRRASSFIFGVCVLAAVLSAHAQPQNAPYVYDGKILQVLDEDFTEAKHNRWQVWLYEEGVHIPRYTPGLQYSRWGLIEGTSAANVVQQLHASQSFEAAYLKFFGPDTWGRHTFFNPLGPIAVTDPALKDQPTALEKLHQLRSLQERVNKLTRTATPSLENNQSQRLAYPVEGYFDQIRDALQRVGKLQSQLPHDHLQLRFIEIGILQAETQVAEAESNLPKITAILPSVKLPTNNAWMSHAETAGSDGTIQVEVRETGLGVSLQQSWTGGDGSMTGTVIVTIIPYADIAKIDFEPPQTKGDDTWTVRVQSASTPFVQTVDSPERKTVRGKFPAVHDRTTESSAYFVFAKSGEAQDAYAYFLYHKQLGR